MRDDELIDNLLRVRRARRRQPGSADLAHVYAALAEEAGSTMSIRAAARALGVSHTALARWIESGDVAVVFTPMGRRDVPLAEVLDLAEGVRELRAAGERRPLARLIMRRRAEAARLHLDVDAHRYADAHERAQARALAYHRVVAARLDPDTVLDARERLRRWRRQGKLDQRLVDRWERALDSDDLRELLSGSEAHDLLQSSPFAGVLREHERRRINTLIH